MSASAITTAAPRRFPGWAAVQADRDVHGPSDDVCPTLKVTTRASPVNTVSEIAADRPGRSGELLHCLLPLLVDIVDKVAKIFRSRPQGLSVNSEFV